MRNLNPEFKNQAQLRLEAETRLRQGSAPPTRGWAVGADTLTLLYRLASAPDTAADALKLLSELQTQQVELDLQHAEFEANQQELAQALAHYRTLFDFAPVGYLVVGLDGQVLEANRAGAERLGTEPGGLAGQPIAPFFAHDSRPAILGLIEATREGALGACCEVVSSDRGNGQNPLRINTSLAPGSEAVLVIVSMCGASPV
ncbi:MAG: PAS domain S-box protein [Thioalkalivibrio sp.]|nr:PAS domain S-box protein [Thioalkalivibrio sp.]